MSAAHDFRTPFLGAAAAALLVLTGAGSAAMASPTTLADVGEPSQTELDDSIDDLDENTTDLLENTDEVETTETDGSETTISLSSDILFDFDSSTVKDAAKTRIRELVADIPDGARIEVFVPAAALAKVLAALDGTSVLSVVGAPGSVAED